MPHRSPRLEGVSGVSLKVRATVRAPLVYTGVCWRDKEVGIGPGDHFSAQRCEKPPQSF
jgi:hypothetical protein